MYKDNFVLKGNIYYSASPKEIKFEENAYLVCVDGISQGVFKKLPEQYSNLPVLDYGNNMIIPGLIDLHVHASQFAFRGTGMDLELMEWLDRYAFPEETKYKDLEYADKAYDIFTDCIRKSATTRAVVFATVHWEATKLLMDKFDKAGLCAYIGKVNMDRLGPDNLKEASADCSLSDTQKFIDSSLNKSERVKPIITPRFIPACSEELLKKLSNIRNNYNLKVQSHLSENLEEVKIVQSLEPESKFYGDAYDRYGLFGGSYDCVMAHCVHSNEKEIALMKNRGVFVAHCPECNANLSSGIAPLRQYLDAGLNVGLGTDIAGGATESIFSAMVDAIRVSKLRWRLMDQKYAPITFAEAFYLGTVGGGKFFGKVGSFEKGYELDALVLTDENQPCARENAPIDRLERFAYIRGDMLGIKAKFVKGCQLY